MNDLVCVLPFVIVDTALIVAIYRNRKRTHAPVTQPEPELIINDPRANRVTQAPIGYRVNESAIKTVPLMTQQSQPKTFESQCSGSIVKVLNDAKIGWRPYVMPDQRRPAPVKGPRTLTFFFRLENTMDLDKVLRFNNRMAYGAGIKQARIARIEGVVAIEFELPSSKWTALALDNPGTAQRLNLGRDTLNRQVRLDLETHVLLAGITDSGKSVAMANILYQAAQSSPDKQKIILIDGKRTEAMRPFWNLPHLLAPPQVEPDAALQALAWTANEILQRGGKPKGSYPSLLVAIDELALLIGQDKRTIQPLAKILSLGREVDVHVAAGTQVVNTEVLGSEMIRANFTNRLAGRTKDSTGSWLATGMGKQGAEHLSGKGDMLLVRGGSNATRLIIAKVSADQLLSLPRIETVPDLMSDTTTESLAMIETMPSQTVASTTPEMYGKMLEAYVYDGNIWPGIRKTSEMLGVGRSGRAQRVLAEAQELVGYLNQAGIDLIGRDER